MPRKVLIAGGGPAALETTLALAEAGDVQITLICPEEEFVYSPVSVAEPFAITSTRRYPLARLTELGVDLVHSAVAEVRPDEHRIRLTDGRLMGYDHLVLAHGATARPAPGPGLTFRGPRDVESLHGLIQDMEGGYVRSVAFVAPEGSRWTLPIYELALQTANRARDLCLERVQVSLITCERWPLEVFGPHASEIIASEMAAAGIDVHTGILGASPVAAERVVALPVLEGRAPAGVPVDAEGFIRVDEVGRVAHVSDVYAIGDGASHMFKQGGLATQQGEIAARLILGETLDRTGPVLRALVITGRDPIYLRRRLDHDADAEVSRSPLWWPPSKIAGKRLSTFLESLDDRPGLERRIAESVSPGVRRVGLIAP